MTPNELLEGSPVQSISNAARILSLHRRNGDPLRAEVHRLVRIGALRLVDPSQCVNRWTISSAELRRYIEFGPRTGLDIVPLRGQAS